MYTIHTVHLHYTLLQYTVILLLLKCTLYTYSTLHYTVYLYFQYTNMTHPLTYCTHTTYTVEYILCKCSSLVESTPHTYSTFTLRYISPSGTPSGDTPPRDCQEVYHRGCTEDGVYTIAPNCPHIKPFKVSCDMKNGKWIVFQRRRHAKLDFNQNWNKYEEGFGDPQYEYWLGLKKLNCLTFSVCAAEMRIDMTDYKGIKKHAIYSSIAVHNADNKYRLDLGAYSGTAGDGMRECSSGINNDGMPFSTHDRDNDN